MLRNLLFRVTSTVGTVRPNPLRCLDGDNNPEESEEEEEGEKERAVGTSSNLHACDRHNVL